MRYPQNEWQLLKELRKFPFHPHDVSNKRIQDYLKYLVSLQKKHICSPQTKIVRDSSIKLHKKRNFTERDMF